MNRLYLNIQKFSDGKVVIDTELNTKDFENGLDKMQNSSKNAGSTIKNIVAGLGITKLISKGLSVISSSIDDAVKRVDTLNNFPKVMSNLGISAEESSEAVDKMSEKLAGLPTTLDQGAAAVQRFTSKNGDVKKSTDLFLALNNAILAGGAPAEIQASALEQLSQSYAKGKPDMMEWRTAMSAMPAQLKQVAIAMGYVDADALGEALREGTVSMDDFMDTITKLNTEGVNGFQSFEEQARNSTGGIQTAIVVAKTQVVKGVASMINGINKSLKKSNLGSISDIVANIGKEVKKQMDNIGKAISKIDFAKVANVIKGLVPIVGSLVAAFIAYQTALKAISAINLAKNITSAISAIMGLTSATQLSSGALQIFNSLMSLNPVGIAIGSIAALTTGVVLLTKHMSESKEEMNRTNQVINDYKKSMDEAREAKQEYLDQNMTEINNYQSLASELDNLVDENGKVKEGYEERAEYIVGELNNALGLEMQLNDGVIQNYKDIKSSIDEIIKSKRAQVLLQAEEKEYNAAMDQRHKLEEQLAKQTTDVTKKLENKHNVEKEIAKTYGLTNEELQDLINNQDGLNNSYGITSAQYDDIYKKISNANEQYRESRGVLTDLKNQYKDNELVITDYEIALKDLENGNYDAVLKMYEDTANFQGKTKEETAKNYDAAILAQKQYLEDLENNRSNYTDEEYNALKSAGESKLKEYEEQRKKYTSTIKKGQEEATKEVEKGANDQVEKIKSKKEDHKKAGKDNTTAYSDGIKLGQPFSDNNALQVANSAVGKLDKKEDAKQKGKDMAQGYADGMSSLASVVGSVAASLANTSLEEMKKTLDIHSPSKKTRKFGKYFDEGFAEGVSNNSKLVYNEVDKFGNNILDRFSNIDYSSIYSDMQNAISTETNKIGSSVQISGASQSVQQMLTASASFDGIIPLQVDLDGEVIYDNQQKISARKNLQYGGVR